MGKKGIIVKLLIIMWYHSQQIPHMRKNMLRVLPIASKRGHNAENILSTPPERGTLFQTIQRMDLFFCYRWVIILMLCYCWVKILNILNLYVCSVREKVYSEPIVMRESVNYSDWDTKNVFSLNLVLIYIYKDYDKGGRGGNSWLTTYNIILT